MTLDFTRVLLQIAEEERHTTWRYTKEVNNVVYFRVFPFFSEFKVCMEREIKGNWFNLVSMVVLLLCSKTPHLISKPEMDPSRGRRLKTRRDFCKFYSKFIL